MEPSLTRAEETWRLEGGRLWFHHGAKASMLVAATVDREENLIAEAELQL
jgi:hypothetical protein